ncbi:hypothetical protein AB836_00110 [Rickettsiales bacterium (ex Bugula neritina AB1)]|nr:hypothetical protein AB836_00110 [Rickettsiales bacterium (ex Bugula neritina AB1)]
MNKRNFKFFYLFLYFNYELIIGRTNDINDISNDKYKGIILDINWINNNNILNKYKNGILVLQDPKKITEESLIKITEENIFLILIFLSDTFVLPKSDRYSMLISKDKYIENLNLFPSINNNDNYSIIINDSVEIKKEFIDTLISILKKNKITTLERFILKEYMISSENIEVVKYLIEETKKNNININKAVFFNSSYEENKELMDNLNIYIMNNGISLENININNNQNDNNDTSQSNYPFDIPGIGLPNSSSNQNQSNKYSLKSVKKALKEKTRILPETIEAILKLHERSFPVYQRECNSPRMSDEARYFKNVMDILFRLPKKITIRKVNKEVLEKVLDEFIEGFKKEKEYFLKTCLDAMETGVFQSPPILYIGPPGVGKTHMATVLAKIFTILSSDEKSLPSSVLNNKNKFGEVINYVNKHYPKHMFKISINTIKEITTLMGSTQTFVGAKPGLLLEALLCSDLMVLLIDEIDKVHKSHTSVDEMRLKSSIQETLLTITDDNGTLMDLYLEILLGTKNICMYMTANVLENIDETLLNRIKIFTVKGLLNEEKSVIFLKSIFNSMYEKGLIQYDDKVKLVTRNNKPFYGLGEKFFISKDILEKIISIHSNIDGARVLKRYVEEIVRSFGIKMRTEMKNKNNNIKLEMNDNNVEEFISFDEGVVSILPNGKNKYIGAMMCIYIKENGNTEVFPIYSMNVNTRSNYGDIQIIDGNEKYNANNSYATFLSAILRNLVTILTKEVVGDLGFSMLSSHLNSNHVVIRLPNDAGKREYRRILLSSLISCISSIRRIPISQDTLVIGEINEVGQFFCDETSLITKLSSAKRSGKIKTVILPENVKNNPVFASHIKTNKNFGLEIKYCKTLADVLNHFFNPEKEQYF